MPATPAAWRDAFRANTTDSAAGGDDQSRSVVVQLDNGNIVVLWIDNSPGTTTFETSVVGQMYDPAGARIGQEFTANGLGGNRLIESFDATALPGNRFVIAYGTRPGAEVDRVVHATEWDTDDRGVTTSVDRPIADSPDAGDILYQPSVDSYSDGRYIVGFKTYDASANETDLAYVTVQASGTVGNTVVAVGGSDSVGDTTAVATLTSNSFVIVSDYDFAGEGAITYRVLGSGGTVPSLVSDTGTDGLFDSAPHVAALAGGGFVIAWQSFDSAGGDTVIRFQRYDVSGTELGGIETVDAAPGNNDTDPHVIALADGGFVIAFDNQDITVISARRYDANGVAVGDLVEIVDSASEYAVTGIGLADGRFALSWTQSELGNADVFAGIYDTRDTPNDPAVYSPADWTLGTTVNDTLDTADGATFYFGSNGNDLFIVDGTVADRRFEAGDGIDTLDASGMTEGARFLFAGSIRSIDGSRVEILYDFENLIGTAFADRVEGNSADNVFRGGGGNDFIRGLNGSDTLFGGDGDDTLNGGNDDDEVYGDAGNDRLYGVDGNDELDGGLGDDILIGGTGNDSLFGRDGADLLTGNPGTDSLFGGAGQDTVFGGAQNDTIDGGDDADQLYGQADNDTITGGAGDDGIFGGGGVDNLSGGAGNDTIFGSIGIDTISGGDGDDYLHGGDDRDTIGGDAGNDTIYGYSGNDTLDGGGGADFLQGGDGDDIVSGGAQGDSVRGGAGNDTVNGNAGEDALFGDAGDDVLNGGDQSDNLRGGAGNDTLTGGAGIDRFSFEPDWGNDTITDFANDGLEKINLSGVAGANSLADLTIAAVGGATQISFDGNFIIVQNSAPGDFDASDFIFASASSLERMVEAAFMPQLIYDAIA